MGKKRKKRISRELSLVKRIFLEIASRLQSNKAKIKKIQAHCKERRQYFFDKWTNKETGQAMELAKSIEDDFQEIVLLGCQNQEKILRLVEGKTLELNKKMSISYRTGAKIPEVLDKNLLIESLENQGKSEGLDIKDLVTAEPVIPKEDMAKAIEILETQGFYLAKIEKNINEETLKAKIKSGELDPEKLRGLKIIQNEFFILHTPDINISEPVKTITKEF